MLTLGVRIPLPLRGVRRGVISRHVNILSLLLATGGYERKDRCLRDTRLRRCIFYLTDIEGYVIIVSQGHRSSGLRDGSMTPDATVTGIVILYYGCSSRRLGEPLESS